MVIRDLFPLKDARVISHSLPLQCSPLLRADALIAKSEKSCQLAFDLLYFDNSVSILLIVSILYGCWQQELVDMTVNFGCIFESRRA